MGSNDGSQSEPRWSGTDFASARAEVRRNDQAQAAAAQALQALQSRAKSGASWFYWIAALSVINTVLTFTQADVSFPLGLGATQFIDAYTFAVSQDTGMAIRYMAVVLDLALIGIFVLFGFLGGKRHTWAFIAGMVLYGLDALLFLIVQDFLGIALHGLALFYLFRGLQANMELTKLESAQTTQLYGTADTSYRPF